MDEPADESVGDGFDRTWLQEFVGLSTQDAIDKAEAQGRPLRVLQPGSAVTLDFRPDRLNVHVDATGNVTGVSAG